MQVTSFKLTTNTDTDRLLNRAIIGTINFHICQRPTKTKQLNLVFIYYKVVV